MEPLPRTAFKAPEGSYELVAERTTGLVPFSPSRLTRLTVARGGGDGDGGGGDGEELLVFNAGDAVHVCRVLEVDNPPLRTLTFPYGPGGALVPPTCHAWRPPPSPGAPDLLVGLASGAAVALSLPRQLAPDGAASTAPAAGELLPPPSGAGAGRAVGVAWGPGDDGGGALVALASGHVCVHRPPWRLGAAAGGAAGSGSGAAAADEATGASPSPPPPARRPPPPALLAAPAGAAAASLSPDGAHLATAGTDGVLRIHRAVDGALVAGCASFYGGLAAAAWSPDARCVAAGGEDDAAAVFGLGERCAVGWADGADSWVAGVAFDDRPACADGDDGSGAVPSGGRLYRLAVASQDCCVALHDVAVPDDDIAAGLPPLSPRAGSGGGGGGAGGFGAAVAAAATAAAAGCAAGLFGGAPPPPGGLFGSPLRPPAPMDADGDAEASASPPPPPPRPARLPPQIAPSPAHADMARVPPVARACASTEPLSAVAFTRDALVTADAVGGVRVWARPRPHGAGGGGVDAVEGGGGARPPRSAPMPARRLGAAASSDHLDLMSL